MAMYDIGARAPKLPVQAAHQVKKRGGVMESYLKAFGSQFFAKHANAIKAVD
jgi:hypothetical protein